MLFKSATEILTSENGVYSILNLYNFLLYFDKLSWIASWVHGVSFLQRVDRVAVHGQADLPDGGVRPGP
jgi:hypothetical protein